MALRFGGTAAAGALLRGGAAAAPRRLRPAQVLAPLLGQARHCGGQAQEADAQAQGSVTPAGAGHAARHAAPPIELPKELRLYQWDEDLAPIAHSAYMRCQLGAVSAALGLASVAFSIQASPGLAAAVAAGALANTYRHTVVTRRSMAAAAMRHVEEIYVRPTPVAEALPAGEAPAGALPAPEGATPEPEVAAKPAEAAAKPAKPAKPAVKKPAHSWIERLAATPELELRVRTATLEMEVTLAEPSQAWEGTRYDGLVADDRPTFAEVCQGGKVLFLIDPSSLAWGQPGSPTSDHPALLAALVNSGKVVAKAEVRTREGVAEVLQAQPEALARTEDLLAQSDKSKSTSVSSGVTPARIIADTGKHSFISGMIFFLAGVMYLERYQSQDEDRWDPTIGDMLAKLPTAPADHRKLSEPKQA